MASDDEFYVCFRGVRGSIPCPGAGTARYGGNTSCLEIRCGGDLLILDGGTGIRPLVKAVAGEGPLDADVFFTHTHLDHICGWPYFTSLLEPDNSLTLQYSALLATEGVDLRFDEDGLKAIADIAAGVNEQSADIGARRLHTVMEKLLEDLSFDAPDMADASVVVDEAMVRERLSDLAEDQDLSQYIL